MQQIILALINVVMLGIMLIVMERQINSTESLLQSCPLASSLNTLGIKWDYSPHSSGDRDLTIMQRRIKLIALEMRIFKLSD